MDSPSIADAVAQATPDVAALLERHAKWCAQMCRNVPSPAAEMCQNLPSPHVPERAAPAEICRNVPEPAGTCHAGEGDKTNPPVYTPRERPLTERQLMAARMIVYGYGSTEVAHQLGVNRHTVAVWKRNPAFRVELGRLHAYVTATVFARPAKMTTTKAAASAPARVRMTRAEVAREDAECEAMIAQMLRAKGVGRP
jgi:DNA-binding CsgD family transcriptional regulator